MSELIKDLRDRDAFVQACQQLHGAECEHNHKGAWNCERTLADGAKFKFVGAAKSEYADKKKFISDGETILDKDLKYNIIYDSCKSLIVSGLIKSLLHIRLEARLESGQNC